MSNIDSHQHFWKFDPVRDSWIDESMSAIRKDFYPDDIAPIFEGNNIDGCVAVQADQSEEETGFLLELAARHHFIKGIVGWVDLQAKHIEGRLEYYSQYKLIKGFRHVLQGEANRALMLSKPFLNGIKALQGFGFTYDLLILPDQLTYSTELVKAFPNMHFVVDHIAKPEIKAGNINNWAAGIKALAAHENVYCKVSGMVTEADWNGWKIADFEPYMNVVFDAFGTKRLMFGSDWPVCNVAGGYERMLSIVKSYTKTLSEVERSLFWGQNAADFYKLS